MKTFIANANASFARRSLVELFVDVNSLTSLRALASSCWFNLTTFSANTNR